MNRRVAQVLRGLTGTLLCLGSAAIAAPNQTPADTAHAAPAARPAEPVHAAPSPAPAVAPTQTHAVDAHPNAVPQDTSTANSTAIARNAADTNHPGNHRGLNGNANNGYFGGYAGAYYPLGYGAALFNPNWTPYNNYNNYNGYNSQPYPAQFTQPEADDQTEPPSVNSQVIPDVAPQPPAAPDTQSATVKSALLASSQWRDADAQVRIAQSQYDAASSIVLAQLHMQPGYQQALAQKAADAQKVSALKAKDPAAPIDRTEAIATAKLDAAQTVTQMEIAAIANDPGAAAAKIKLDTAIAQRQEIQRGIESSLSPAKPQPQ